MTIRPMAMPEGVVLDPAGLDLAQAAPGVDRAAADRVDGAVDDLAVEPPDGGRDPPADDDEQQVVEVVEPPLVERGAVQERQPGRSARGRAPGGPASRMRPDARRRTAARRGRCRSTATVTLARISTPSMPNSW